MEARSLTYTDGTSSATFGYDAGGAAAHAIGQLTSIGNGNSVTSFTNFDAVGRVTASQQQTGSVTYPAFYYWYNLAGELTKEQYPSGRTVSTSYDSAGRVSGITGLLGSTSTTYLSNISYWPHGAVYQQKYGNNLWRSYTFNSRLQVNQQWDAIYNAPSYFLSFEIYNWGTSNNNGNLQSRNEYFGGPTTFGSLQEITQNYSYDTLSRVQYFSEASSGSQGVCGGTCSYRYYGYDRWGNQWITANGGLPNPALATTTNNYNPATNYRYDEAYDGAGNQTSVDGDNATYDAENRLRLLVNPMTGAMETFLYDGAGRRVQKSYSGNTTNYVYDALGFLVAEYAGSTVSKEYIPFGSQVIAVENASGTPCQTCYLNYDHLGSVRLVTDQSANVVARHDYVPYGEEIFPPYAGRTAPFGNTDYVNPRFTGQMRDTENLLDFFNARYFGPGLGRFVSPDPMNAGADVGNPQSWNGYLYGLGNPVVYTDPSGEHWEVTGTCLSYDTSGSSSSCSYNWTWVDDPTTVISIGGSIPTGGGGGGGDGGGAQPNPSAKNGTCAANISLLDLPGQWFAGFVDLALNNKPSGAARMGAAMAANLAAGAAIAKGAQLAGTAWALGGAQFAQQGASATFSASGPLRGLTVRGVAQALASGSISASQVPVQYVIQDGTPIILNTRSAMALTLGGVGRPLWSAADVTADLAANLRVAAQLARNPGAPTSTAVLGGSCPVSLGKYW